MADDELDRGLRRIAREHRADVERSIDEFDVEVARLGLDHRTPAREIMDDGRSWRSAALIGAAACAVALVGGLVLLWQTEPDRAASTRDVDDSTVPTGSVLPTAPISANTTPMAEPSVPVSAEVTPTTMTTATTSSTSPGTTTSLDTSELAIPLYDWRSDAWEPSRIPRRCVGEFRCTQLRPAPDGATIAINPATRELTRYDADTETVVLPESYGDVWVEIVGPDAVAYLFVDPADGDTGTDLPRGDLALVSVASGDVGREIARIPGAANYGDSDWYPTEEGLVDVGCCGEEAVRPDPSSSLVQGWLGQDGRPVTGEGTISVSESDGNYVVRRGGESWGFEPGGYWGFRTVRTHHLLDGGTAVHFPAVTGSADLIVRTYPDGGARTAPFEAWTVEMVEATGTVIVADGERFVRVQPFAPTEFDWDGTVEVDVEAGRAELPGFDDAVAEQVPVWAGDPVAFAHVASGPLAVNEVRTVTSRQNSEFSWTVVVTNSGFFDDSVDSTRFTFALIRGEDGLFRIEEIGWANRCQPGRGHQDLTAELCT